MRQTILAVFAASLLVIAPTATSAQYGAEQTKDVLQVDFSPASLLIIFNPNGESYMMDSGRLVNRISQVAKGDQIHTSSQFRITNATGRGLTSGAFCRANDESSSNYSGSVDGYNYSSRGAFKVNCDGKADLLVQFTFHVNYDPQKGYQVTVDNFRVK